jgi:hypothetical protein
MPIAVKAYEWFRPLLSQAIQERVHLIPPKHSDGYIAGIAPPSALPCCYGGELTAFPPELVSALGYERVDAATRALWFPGAPAHLGQFYVPQNKPERAMQEGVTETMPSEEMPETEPETMA